LNSNESGRYQSLITDYNSKFSHFISFGHRPNPERPGLYPTVSLISSAFQVSFHPLKIAGNKINVLHYQQAMWVTALPISKQYG